MNERKGECDKEQEAENGGSNRKKKDKEEKTFFTINERKMNRNKEKVTNLTD